MVKRQTIIPIAAAIRLIEKVGAERVSDKAGLELAQNLEDIAKKISQKAIVFAEHAGRKTVKSSDIKLACKEFLD